MKWQQKQHKAAAWQVCNSSGLICILDRDAPHSSTGGEGGRFRTAENINIHAIMLAAAVDNQKNILETAEDGEQNVNIL